MTRQPTLHETAYETQRRGPGCSMKDENQKNYSYTFELGCLKLFLKILIGPQVHTLQDK
jgi:hypothetical protein